jgi:hypothetical protein
MKTMVREVGMNVRMPEELRWAVRRYALDTRTSVEALVNRLLREELARGGTNVPAGPIVGCRQAAFATLCKGTSTLSRPPTF